MTVSTLTPDMTTGQLCRANGWGKDTILIGEPLRKSMTGRTITICITAVGEQWILAYDAEMRLPEGKTCADCVHLSRCVEVLGCTTPERTSCDFHPRRFVELEPVGAQTGG